MRTLPVCASLALRLPGAQRFQRPQRTLWSALAAPTILVKHAAKTSAIILFIPAPFALTDLSRPEEFATILPIRSEEKPVKMVRVTSALFPMDSTLCIIKPDAMRLGYKQNICHMIHMFGFNVVAEGTFKLTRVRAEQFYRAHAKMPYFETLIRFMISRSIHCMVLVRDNCCRAFRALLGPKDSNRARREAPQTIRALYGTDGRMNAVHGSDTVKQAEIEIKFFFPTVILEPYPTSQDAAAYFKEHVQPLLLKGLTALAKSKPASETTGAVRWLAHWLHDHNPRLPLICICVEKKFDALKEEPVIEFPFY